MNHRLEHALTFAQDFRLGKTPRPHYVYLIQCCRYVKIGIASDPVKRVRDLQIGNPFALKILAVQATFSPRKCESELHAELARFRMCGEWFNVPKRELDKLIARMQPAPETPRRNVKRVRDQENGTPI